MAAEQAPSFTTGIGIEIHQAGCVKWSEFVDGGDGILYGIPAQARHVVKFNPLDLSLTEIGPDFGEGRFKWWRKGGVRAKTGSIYCVPYVSSNSIPKISTNDGTVETLDDVEMPERGRALWESGALAADNNIYYMPTGGRRIMKLNPDDDSLSSVWDDISGRGYGGRSGMVVGKDDCVYGTPAFTSTRTRHQV
jgi:hypothetical protein